MTVQVSGSVDSARSPFSHFHFPFQDLNGTLCWFSGLVVMAGLWAAAHAEENRDPVPVSECPRAEVQAHVLAQFRLYGPLSERREYFGFIYRLNGVIESSVVKGSICGSNHTCGLKTQPAALGIPAGAKVLGEWHTHPAVDGSRNLSMEDVRGAFHNRLLRCYTAFYSTPSGEVWRWDANQTSVPTAMNSREYLGNLRDQPPVLVAHLHPGKIRPLAELPENP